MTQDKPTLKGELDSNMEFARKQIEDGHEITPMIIAIFKKGDSYERGLYALDWTDETKYKMAHAVSKFLNVLEPEMFIFVCEAWMSKVDSDKEKDIVGPVRDRMDARDTIVVVAESKDEGLMATQELVRSNGEVIWGERTETDANIFDNLFSGIYNKKKN